MHEFYLQDADDPSLKSNSGTWALSLVTARMRWNGESLAIRHCSVDPEVTIVACARDLDPPGLSKTCPRKLLTKESAHEFTQVRDEDKVGD